jgi:thioredoxin reductase (NADPH)
MYDLAIVGGGPAGISLVAEAIEAGFEKEKIVVLEKEEKESWIIRKLYPEQKLVTANYKGQDPSSYGIMKFHDMSKEDAIDILKETIEKYNANILFNKNVTSIEKIDDLFHITIGNELIKAKNCAIAIGVFGKPRKPSYKIPSNLKKLTSFDITSSDISNSKVLVVGGGDSASEYVQHLFMKNNQLTISIRSKQIEHMNEENEAIIRDMQTKQKIRLLLGNDVESIEEKDGKILVNFKDMEAEIFDRIVYALGGTTPMNFLKVIGIEFSEEIPKLTKNYETSIEGLYLIGDLGSGKQGGAIIHAFNSSYFAIQDIKKTINSNI